MAQVTKTPQVSRMTKFTFKASKDAGAESREFEFDIGAWFARLTLDQRLAVAESYIKRVISVGTKDAPDGAARFRMIESALAEMTTGVIMPAEFARKARAQAAGLNEVEAEAVDMKIAAWCAKMDKVPGLVKNTSVRNAKPKVQDYIDAAATVPAFQPFVVAKAGVWEWNKRAIADWVAANDAETLAAARAVVEARTAGSPDAVLTVGDIVL